MAQNSAGFTLSGDLVAAGYRVSGFNSVTSTNSMAMQCAREGAKERLWVTALTQTQGRGRRGRDWQSEEGNLAASLLLYPSLSARETALLGFVAGVALVRAIVSLQKPDAIRPKLKWPNDLLHEGAKLAGILLESEQAAPGRQAVVVGIGVNIVSAPQNLAYTTTSLYQMGLECSAQTLFSSLAECWATCRDEFYSHRGRAKLLAEWRDNAAGIDKTISAERSGRRIRGIFETIDEEGRLIMRLASGEKIPITAGDISISDQHNSKERN